MLASSELILLLERVWTSTKPDLSSLVTSMSSDCSNAVNTSSVHGIVRPCIVSSLSVIFQIIIVPYVEYIRLCFVYYLVLCYTIFGPYDGMHGISYYAH